MAAHLIAVVFNRQQSWERGLCYAELAVFLNYTYPQRNGQAELAYVAS